MVSNPLAASSSSGGDVSNRKKRDAAIHCSLDSAARQVKHQYGHDVKYAAAFLRPSGQWAIFCSPDLPAPAQARFSHALATSQSDLAAAARRDSAAFSDSTSQSSAFDLDDDDQQESVQLSPVKPEPLTSEVFSTAIESAREQTKKRKRPADEGDEETPFDTDEDSAELSDTDEEAEEGDSSPATRSTTVQFHIPRSTEDFFHRRFKSVQQLALKALLKVWIKTVEPKKQSRYSYVGRVRPPWWPEEVRFKEPDHLHSNERVALAKLVLQIYRHDHLVNQLEKPCHDYARRGTARNGWIDMLRNSTKDLNLAFEQEKNPEERRVRRQKILADIYDAAFVLEEIHHDEKDATFTKTYPEPVISKRGRTRKPADPNPRPRKTLNSMDASTEDASALVSVTSQLHIEPASDSKPLPPNVTSHTQSRPQSHANTHYRPIEPARHRSSQQSAFHSLQPMTSSPKELSEFQGASKLNSPTYFPSRETSLGPGTHASPGRVFHAPIPTPAPRLDRTRSGTGLQFSQSLQSQVTPKMDPENDSGMYQDPRYVDMRRQHTNSPHTSQAWETPIVPTTMPSFPTSQPSQDFQQQSPFISPTGPDSAFGYSTTPPLHMNTSNPFPVSMDHMSGLPASHDVSYGRQQSCATVYDGFGDNPFEQMFFAPPPNEEEQNSFFNPGYPY